MRQELHHTAAMVLRAMPPELARAVRAHTYADDPDDLIGQAALAWLEAARIERMETETETENGRERIIALRAWNTARSAARRFAEGGNSIRTRCCVCIDEQRAGANDDEWEPWTDPEEMEARMERERQFEALEALGIKEGMGIETIQKRLKVGKRRAYQILRQQLEAAAAGGDMLVEAEAAADSYADQEPPTARRRRIAPPPVNRPRRRTAARPVPQRVAQAQAQARGTNDLFAQTVGVGVESPDAEKRKPPVRGASA